MNYGKLMNPLTTCDYCDYYMGYYVDQPAAIGQPGPLAHAPAYYPQMYPWYHQMQPVACMGNRTFKTSNEVTHVTGIQKSNEQPHQYIEKNEPSVHQYFDDRTSTTSSAVTHVAEIHHDVKPMSTRSEARAMTPMSGFSDVSSSMQSSTMATDGSVASGPMTPMSEFSDVSSSMQSSTMATDGSVASGPMTLGMINAVENEQKFDVCWGWKPKVKFEPRDDYVAATAPEHTIMGMIDAVENEQKYDVCWGARKPERRGEHVDAVKARYIDGLKQHGYSEEDINMNFIGYTVNQDSNGKWVKNIVYPEFVKMPSETDGQDTVYAKLTYRSCSAPQLKAMPDDTYATEAVIMLDISKKVGRCFYDKVVYFVNNRGEYIYRQMTNNPCMRKEMRYDEEYTTDSNARPDKRPSSRCTEGRKRGKKNPDETTTTAISLGIPAYDKFAEMDGGVYRASKAAYTIKRFPNSETKLKSMKDGMNLNEAKEISFQPCATKHAQGFVAPEYRRLGKQPTMDIHLFQAPEYDIFKESVRSLTDKNKSSLMMDDGQRVEFEKEKDKIQNLCIGHHYYIARRCRSDEEARIINKDLTEDANQYSGYCSATTYVGHDVVLDLATKRVVMKKIKRRIATIVLPGLREPRRTGYYNRRNHKK